MFDEVGCEAIYETKALSSARWNLLFVLIRIVDGLSLLHLNTIFEYIMFTFYLHKDLFIIRVEFITFE